MLTWRASTWSVREASFDVYPIISNDYFTIDLLESGFYEIEVDDILVSGVLAQNLYSGDRLNVSSFSKGKLHIEAKL